LQSTLNEAEAMMQGLKALLVSKAKTPEDLDNTMKELVTGLMKWHHEVGKKKSNPREEEGNWSIELKLILVVLFWCLTRIYVELSVCNQAFDI